MDPTSLTIRIATIFIALLLLPTPFLLALYYLLRPTQHYPKSRQASVTVLVLGDIGRSPRMQYHALSLLSHGASVSLIGYVESPLHPSFSSPEYAKRLTIYALAPTPPLLTRLTSNYPFLFPLLAPLKAIQQTLTLFTTLAYTTTPSKSILIQNPPAIPVLAISILVARLRKSNLVIDWHNLGYSLLALRFPGCGEAHPLVRLARVYEYKLARFANTHLSVTDALSKHLIKHARLAGPKQPKILHDRPGELFQPYFTPGHPTANDESRTDFLRRLEITAPYADALTDPSEGRMRLLVSPTSWTADEDFGVLLDALVSYNELISTSTTSTSPNSSSNSTSNPRKRILPPLLTIITGTGPLLPAFLTTLTHLNALQKLEHTPILTAFLPQTDYVRLLSAADLGISLHTSSSGLDFPMKVLDMFGAGTAVVGCAGFEAWGERVKEGLCGYGFEGSKGLVRVLGRLFGRDGMERGDGKELERITRGAVEEGRRRWEDEWDDVARDVFFD